MNAVKHVIGNLLTIELYLEYQVRSFFKSLWNEFGNWKTFTIFIIVWLVMASPTWLGYILFFIFKNRWFLGIASTSLFFWNCVPCTPFIPICIAITLGIKKLIKT